MTGPMKIDIPTGARYFRVDRRDHVYLKFIVEAYEGLTTLSTVDKKGGVVRVCYPLCFSDDVAALCLALGQEIVMHEVPQPEGCPGLPPLISGEEVPVYAR